MLSAADDLTSAAFRAYQASFAAAYLKTREDAQAAAKLAEPVVQGAVALQTRVYLLTGRGEAANHSYGMLSALHAIAAIASSGGVLGSHDPDETRKRLHENAAEFVGCLEKFSEAIRTVLNS